MTRTVYLIRHAMPDIPLGERWCVGGRTDLPLGELGRLQAALLPFVPELEQVGAVFCSPMRRAIETARPLCPVPHTMPGLEEQDMGVWDGLSFREIRGKYPALYAARERCPALLPEGAEKEEAVRARMLAALRRCLAESKGDIAAVSHKGSIASVVGERGSLDYTSVTALRLEDGEPAGFELLGKARPALTDEICLALLKASKADKARIAHCRAVAGLADMLGKALSGKGIPLDTAAIHQAALLHDLAKGHPDHAALGGVWLRELGYPAAADIVRQHTEPDGSALNEAAVVFYADKAVRNDRRVPVAERFEASLAKCTTPEAMAAHDRRRQAAEAVQEQLIQLCGEELLQQEGLL